MSRALPTFHRRRILVAGVVGGTLCATVAVGAAMAGQSKSSSTATTRAATDTIVCPDVASQLPAVPAESQAEVDRNLALLQTQIGEANTRLANTVGQGGPDFVQNAILGPLADKRTSTIDRIAISIGRHADKSAGLDSLAICELSSDAGAGADTGAEASASPSESAAEADPSASASEGGAAADGQSIVCPDVAAQVGAVPAAAQAEVDRNLSLLQTQIGEANTRLANTAGQGGPDFVQNAILGPLADKRTSTIDRIVLAISRQGETAPSGLNALAGCALSG